MTERRFVLAALVLLVAAAPIRVASAQQRPARPAQGRPAARPDTAGIADSLRVEYRREVFSYQGGARDPFLTLITSGDVRPTINDLRLVSIVYDARGGGSVAVVQEAVAGGTTSHRLRRGSQIGRLRVIQIRQTEVVFQVEEFGFERQQVLSFPRPEANR